jgi:UDP-3-O-[3-hydroxymyristoyl] glucosamine N-acyltransferase
MNSKEIADFLGGRHIGDVQTIKAIKGFDPVNTDANALMWVSEKNVIDFSSLACGIIIVPETAALPESSKCSFIKTASPRRAFQKVISKYFKKEIKPAISSTSIIHPSVKMGKDCFIGEHVVIEENAKIGDNVTILHNTVIKSDTIIGNNCSVGCNCTIGGGGFGHEPNEFGRYERIEHIGNVVFEDDVEIGNNTCVDRAVMGSTILRKNVKVDNLVHIAHGCDIGENCLVIANAMIAGSVKMGKNCWVAPSASVLNKLTVAADVTIGLATVVIKDAGRGEVLFGNPARAIRVKEIKE